MTYSSGNSVQSTDYNTFANAAANINSVWGTAYGQPTIPNVVSGAKVSSSEWTLLVDVLNKSTKHQTGSNSSIANTSTTSSSKISILNGQPAILTDAITGIKNNIFNAAVQGSVASNTITNNTPWKDLLTFNTVVTFANTTQAQYFFNAGGQIGLSYTHSANTIGINPLIANICASVGTIWISAPGGANGAVLAGTSYRGVTKIGGSGNLTSINSTGGYYGLTTTPLQIVRQTSEVVYKSSVYSSTNLTISASSNGSSITITSSIDETFSIFPSNIDIPTTMTVSIRSPGSTILANTWGAVSVSSNITTVI